MNNMRNICIKVVFCLIKSYRKAHWINCPTVDPENVET